MNKVIYNSKFKAAIELAKDKDFFIGTGNPNAKLLFIGKEAAIDKEKHPKHYEIEITNNVADWRNNSLKNTQFHEVDNWFIETQIPTYNPLYPYKGQKNRVQSRLANGEIKSGKGGTSKTWYNYQKIVDKVFHENNVANNINFHEYIFISELNQETGKYSHLVSKEERKNSITSRTSLFETPFFRDFPIKIVAVGHYVRDFNIDLQDIFEMKFDEVLSKKLSEGLTNEYINVHFDDLEKPTKLLIHTNQLSMVSNELINRLGQICNDYLKQIQ